MGVPSPHPHLPARFVMGLEDSPSTPGHIIVTLECTHKFEYPLTGLAVVAAQGPQGEWLFLNCAHCAVTGHRR